MRTNPSIVMINETNPKNFIYTALKSEFHISGYTMLTSGFYEKGKRGIIAYIDNNLSGTEIVIKSKFQEYICFKITSDKLSTNFLLIYRSPNSIGENNDQLIILLEGFMKLKGQKIIVGDFNLPQINWNTLTLNDCIQHENLEIRLIDFIRKYYLTQHVQEPTRWRGKNEPGILDLVLSDTDFIEHLNIDAPIAKSDHGCITMDLHLSVCVKKIMKKPAYNRGDYNSIRKCVHDYLVENNTGNDREGENVNMLWERMRNCIIAAIEKFIPKTGMAKFKTFISPELKNLIRRKHLLWKMYIRTKTSEVRYMYNKVRNEVTKMMKETRKENQQKIAKQCKENPKAFWNYVNRRRKTQESMADLRKEIDGNEIVIRDDRVTAEMLAILFSSVYVTEKTLESEKLKFKTPDIYQEMPNLLIDENVVYKKLNELNVVKSPGPDKIHPKVWHELKDIVCPYLANLFGRSLSEGELPNDWKCSEVIGLFKKGSKQDVKNYRPVSLTCIICKVMESIIKDHLLDHFTRNNLFSCRQFGFLKKRSTVLQLLRFIDEVTESVDRGEEFHIIYTDIEKAFDRVPHNKLLFKLKMHRVDENVLNWIKSFLTGRKFRVRVGECFSELHAVGSGVPQGSILGPLLFIVYINDLIEPETNENILLFADDSKIYKKINSETDCLELQRCLSKVIKWFDCWDMKVNAGKCNILRINTKHKLNFNYKINGDTIVDVGSARDLGVVFDTKLTFKEHIHGIVNRAYIIMGLLRRHFDMLDKKSFVCIYKSLVRSQMEYASSVWSPYRLGLIELLEKTQRRATKIFKGCKNLKYHDRLKLLDLPSMVQRRKRGDMIEVFKILNGHYEEECVPFLQMAAEKRTRGNSQRLQKRQARKDIRKYSFCLRVVNEWNDLPEKVVNSKSVNEFKRNIDVFWGPKKFRTME